MKSEMNETVNILLGFGGSGGKTVAHLMEQMANDPQAARVASQRVYIVLCDTDDADLEKAKFNIEKAFRETGLSDHPRIETFRLADSVDLFQDLVSERMRAMTPEGKAAIRQYWWFEPTRDGRGDRPFSAATMPENVNRGAAQCPLVSHFLAWDKLAEFERVLERITTYCKNTLNLEHFSIDLFVIAGLAGGTGRGSWQSLAFKAREYFWQERNGRRACRPIGFFFDWSCFSDVAAQRPEQAIKLQVNSYTGLSELAMWLRSAVPADSVIANQDAAMARERAFVLPSLRAPADRSAAAIDTERYMPEDDEARLGRTPIHRAYIFTNSSRSMTVQRSEQAYQLAAAAIYGRLCISQTRSADSNEPERACATATSVLAVPIAKIRLAILREANAHRIMQLLHGLSRTDSSGEGGEPLTRTESGNVVVAVHEDLKTIIAHEVGRLNSLLRIGSAEQFAAFGAAPQKDPSKPISVLAFAVSRKGDESLLGMINNNERRHTITEEVDRAVASVTSLVPSAVIGAFREILRSDKSAVESEHSGTAALRESERISRTVFGEFVLKPVQKVLADSGVGPARAMIAELGSAVDAAIRSIQRVSGDDGVSGPAASESWSAQYFGLFGRLKKTQSDGFRQAVRERLCSAAYPAVARELKAIADSVREEIGSVEQMLDDSVKVLESERSRIIRQSAQLRKECFTTLRTTEGRVEDQDKMLVALQDDRNEPVKKMIRSLRPVYDEAKFRQLVGELARDTKAVASARAELMGFLIQRISAQDRRTERAAYEFRASLEERLVSVLNRQSIEFHALRDAYSIETVLGELAEAWFETYKERKSNAVWALALSREIESLTGYDIAREFDSAADRSAAGRSSTEDELRPIGGEDLMCEAALRLAAGCDPFVQYTATGDRRDRATLIMPSHAVSDRAKAYISKVEDLSRRSGAFAHVKAITNPENYFMVVATADLPKVNFVNTGWDGWFAEPSDPAVRKWLDWCEDEQGIAPFKTADGSVGLGYICPKYVRDHHLSVRRWKPWIKDDRNREQMHRKWVALAYSLVGNTWYRSEVNSEWASRYGHFVDVFSKTFGVGSGTNGRNEAPNPDFPDERWTLPLLIETEGGRGPTFTRRSWVGTAQGLRLTGIDPRELEDVTSSMRKFVNWFDSEESDRAVSAMLVEQALFANRLRKSRDSNDLIHTVTSQQHAEAIRKFLREFVWQWQAAIRDVKGLASEERDRQVEFLDRFIRFFDSGMPDLNLLEPFDGMSA